MTKSVGRPTKFTDEVIDIIVSATARGCFAHVAAQAAGIDRVTFHRWMNDDTKSDFRNAVNAARAQARGVAEARVWQDNPEKWLTAGPGRDKASDEGWATVSKHEHTGEGGGPITSQSMDLSRLTRQELAAWHALASKVEGDQGDAA